MLLRRTSAAVLLLVLSGYVLSVVSGRLPVGQRLGLTELVVVVVFGAVAAVLVWPSLLEHVTHFKLGALELDLEHRVKNLESHTKKQELELEDAKFVLRALVSERELRHLRELAEGSTAAHSGREELRNELRRLRGIGLITNNPNVRIGAIRDGTSIILKDFVELTDQGREYLRKITGELPVGTGSPS